MNEYRFKATDKSLKIIISALKNREDFLKRIYLNYAENFEDKKYYECLIDDCRKIIDHLEEVLKNGSEKKE